jgi:hypothetical protein
MNLSHPDEYAENTASPGGSATTLAETKLSSNAPSVLDSAHLGDIRGAFGTIRQHDTEVRKTWRARLTTLMAVIGPGLIVMVGDNDAGAFGTYTQAASRCFGR